MYLSDYGPHLRVAVHGIAEPLGRFYARRLKACGTRAIAGIAPGSGGTSIEGIPTFDLVEQAIASVGEIDVSLIFESADRVLDAALEAIAGGIRQLILVTSGVPPLDMMRLLSKAEAVNARVLGSGSSGIFVPGRVLLGTYEPHFYRPGRLGIVSCARCLTDEVARALGTAGYGQSFVVNLGTDEIAGSSYEMWLEMLEQDDNTDAIVLVGRAGSGDEAAAAEYIASDMAKPVVAYLAGVRVPARYFPSNATTAIAASFLPVPYTCALEPKIAALQAARVAIAERPSQIPALLQATLSSVS